MVDSVTRMAAFCKFLLTHLITKVVLNIKELYVLISKWQIFNKNNCSYFCKNLGNFFQHLVTLIVESNKGHTRKDEKRFWSGNRSLVRREFCRKLTRWVA